MSHFKQRKLGGRRRRKMKGYIVKGISIRHWWDRWDKDDIVSTRQILKRDTRCQVEEATTNE